jgi:mono/diheme cytochrome c family protein
MQTRNLIMAGVAFAAIVAGTFWFMAGQHDPAPASPSAAPLSTRPTGLVEVIVPVLSGDQKIGATAFATRCAACHGPNASGKEGAGPPLVHKIYEPNHHGDMAFVLAAQNGVRAHHWPFGDMPPVTGITRAEVLSIVTYVRALQRANGIM